MEHRYYLDIWATVISIVTLMSHSGHIMWCLVNLALNLSRGQERSDEVRVRRTAHREALLQGADLGAERRDGHPDGGHGEEVCWFSWWWGDLSAGSADYWLLLQSSPQNAWNKHSPDPVYCRPVVRSISVPVRIHVKIYFMGYVLLHKMFKYNMIYLSISFKLVVFNIIYSLNCRRVCVCACACLSFII